MFCGRERKLCSLQGAQEQRINSLWLREMRSNIKQRLNLQKCHSFTIQQMRLEQSLSKNIQDRWRDYNHVCWHLSCLVKALMLSTLHKNWYGKVRYIAELRREQLWGISARCRCLPDQKLHRIPDSPTHQTHLMLTWCCSLGVFCCLNCVLMS